MSSLGLSWNFPLRISDMVTTFPSWTFRIVPILQDNHVESEKHTLNNARSEMHPKDKVRCWHLTSKNCKEIWCSVLRERSRWRGVGVADSASQKAVWLGYTWHSSLSFRDSIPCSSHFCLYYFNKQPEALIGDSSAHYYIRNRSCQPLYLTRKDYSIESSVLYRCSDVSDDFYQIYHGITPLEVQLRLWESDIIIAQ